MAPVSMAAARMVRSTIFPKASSEDRARRAPRMARVSSQSLSSTWAAPHSENGGNGR